MPILRVIKGLPGDIPLELGRRKTLHEDEARRRAQGAAKIQQDFERAHFEKGKFFNQEAERMLGKDLAAPTGGVAGGSPGVAEDACWKETPPPEPGWYEACGTAKGSVPMFDYARYWHGGHWSTSTTLSLKLGQRWITAKAERGTAPRVLWLRKLRADEIPEGVEL